MSVKRKTFSADFKAKLVLEVLKEEQSINEIASKYEVLPKSLKDWKKQFLENISLAFDKSTVVKEYKNEIEELVKSNDSLAKKVGNLTIEKDFLEGKLVSLASSKERKILIDAKHNLSLNKQCTLLHIIKGTLYYSPVKLFSKNGKFYWVIVNILPKLDENGEITGYIVSRKLPQRSQIKVAEEDYKEIL